MQFFGKITTKLRSCQIYYISYDVITYPCPRFDDRLANRSKVIEASERQEHRNSLQQRHFSEQKYLEFAKMS